MIRILLLEDDASLIDGLEYSLRKNGFDVETVRTVRGAMTCLRQSAPYDLLLLDVTQPDGTGFEVCEKLRADGSQLPIIFLTASDEEVNVIRGLDSGADDYITKPFKLGELCSRIRALLRRTNYTAEPVLRCPLDGLCRKPCDGGRRCRGTDTGRIPPAQPACAERRPRCHQRDDLGCTLGQYRGFCGRQYLVRVHTAASRES